MNRTRRSNLVGGLSLVLLGLLVLIIQLLPGVEIHFSWPWIVIGFGVVLLLILLGILLLIRSLLRPRGRADSARSANPHRQRICG